MKITWVAIKIVNGKSIFKIMNVNDFVTLAKTDSHKIARIKFKIYYALKSE